MRRPLSLAVVAALVAAGCGSASDGAAPSDGAPGTIDRSRMMSTTSGPASGEDAADRGASVLPSVSLVDVATGETVDLSQLAPSATPMLAWFWAPF